VRKNYLRNMTLLTIGVMFLIPCFAFATDTGIDVELRTESYSTWLSYMEPKGYGSYTPWTIKVDVENTLYGVPLVEVFSGGHCIYRGEIRAGGSTGWLTTNGQTTYVYFTNYFEWDIHVSGTIYRYES